MSTFPGPFTSTASSVLRRAALSSFMVLGILHTTTPEALSDKYPLNVTVDPTGRFVYVALGDSTVAAYAIDGATGNLMPIAGPAFSSAAAVRRIGIQPDERTAYATNGLGVMSSLLATPPVQIWSPSEARPSGGSAAAGSRCNRRERRRQA